MKSVQSEGEGNKGLNSSYNLASGNALVVEMETNTSHQTVPNKLSKWDKSEISGQDTVPDHEVHDKQKVTKIDVIKELFKRNDDAQLAIGKPLGPGKEDQKVTSPIKPKTKVKNYGTSKGPKQGLDKGK